MTNKRTIMWLLIGILLLAGANFMLARNATHKAALVQKTSLLTIPDDAVSLIEVSRNGEVESLLTRTGEWRIVEPFSGSADESAVLRLVDALAYAPVKDAFGDKELLKLGRTRADFDLAPPRLSVRVRSGGQETRIGFGSFTPSKAEVYACVDGYAAVFVVPSNTLSAVDLTTERFRRRTILTVGEDNVVSMDVKRGIEFLRFKKEGDVWLMTQPTAAPAASAKVKKLLADMTSARAVDFVWPVGASNEISQASAALLAGYGLDAESAVTVTLRGADGGPEKRISLGNEASEGLVYALVDNGAAIVTVDRALKDQATVGGAAFSDTRMFPYDLAHVTGLSLSDGGVSCLLAKQEDGSWRMDAPVSAEADAPAVESLLAAVLALRGGDADEDGIEVGVAPDARTAKVSRRSLGVGFNLESLRSLDMQKIDPATVRRLSVTGTDTNSTTSVVYDRDRRAWNVETSPKKGTVVEDAVARLLKAVCPLRAARIVKLKVTADDLSNYGLDKPALTVAIDLAKDDAIRRNILVGDRTDGGRFATVGASDAVFVLPDAAYADLSRDIVGE